LTIAVLLTDGIINDGVPVQLEAADLKISETGKMLNIAQSGESK